MLSVLFTVASATLDRLRRIRGIVVATFTIASATLDRLRRLMVILSIRFIIPLAILDRLRSLSTALSVLFGIPTDTTTYTIADFGNTLADWTVSGTVSSDALLGNPRPSYNAVAGLKGAGSAYRNGYQFGSGTLVFDVYVESAESAAFVFGADSLGNGIGVECVAGGPVELGTIVAPWGNGVSTILASGGVVTANVWNNVQIVVSAIGSTTTVIVSLNKVVVIATTLVNTRGGWMGFTSTAHFDNIRSIFTS